MNKLDLEDWAEGVKSFEKGDWKNALEIFKRLSSLAKINFNIGMIFCKIRNHHSSISAFNNAMKQDPYFAAASFQQGYASIVLKDYSRASKNFLRCLELLLDNEWIDYHPLGLSFKLYRCEVLFNLVICFNQLGDINRSSRYLTEAKYAIVTPEQHAIILIEYYRRGNVIPFAIPGDSIFKIPTSKQNNLKKREFLKECKVVVDANSDQKSGFVGFTGAVILNPVLVWEEGVTTLVRNKIIAPKGIAQASRKSFTLPPLGSSENTTFKKVPKALPSKTKERIQHIQKESETESLKWKGKIKESDRTLINRKALITPRKSSLPLDYLAANDGIPPVPKLNMSKRDPKLQGSSVAPSHQSGIEDLTGMTMDRNSSTDSIDIVGFYDVCENRSNSIQTQVVVHTGGNKKFTLATSKNITLEAFQNQVCGALNYLGPIKLFFTEDDDPECFISIVDQDDLTYALGTQQDTIHLYTSGNSNLSL